MSHSKYFSENVSFGEDFKLNTLKKKKSKKIHSNSSVLLTFIPIHTTTQNFTTKNDQ